MLDDEDFRNLIERSALVREMAEHPGWEMLADRARVNLFSRQKALIQGQAKDYEDYVKKTSWMEGVSFVLDLPLVVENELRREIEEREAAEKAKREDEDEDPFPFDIHADL